MPYSRVYQTAQFGELMRDLEAHLRPLGPGAVPALRRSNETPLAAGEQLFTAEVVDRSRSTTPPTSSSSATRGRPLRAGGLGEYSGAELAEVSRSPSGPMRSARSARRPTSASSAPEYSPEAASPEGTTSG